MLRGSDIGPGPGEAGSGEAGAGAWISCRVPLDPTSGADKRGSVVAEFEPRRTKILCTIGPASWDVDTLERLIRAGMDVARLNFSHGSHDGHREVFNNVREAEARVGKPVAILQDLQGPKIRLGRVAGEVRLSVGDEVRLSSRNDFEGDASRLPTSYERLAQDVSEGEVVLLADGRLQLRVESIDGEDVRFRVEVGGVVSSRKGMNLPGTRLSIPSLTPKDIEDLEFGLALGVDYVALSFVRAPYDVEDLRRRMRKQGRVVPIISKIEKPQAVELLEEITDVSDGIMVARGDLGVEVAPEMVPGIQRRAIRMARERNKLTVVATQMLMSMTSHARPTHAEVSDVANAVFDGADAVMLSDETAAGDFPIRSVETMAALVHSAQDAPECYAVPDLVPELAQSHAGAISRAALVTAQEMSADAIVSYTRGGLGPRLVSNFRPRCKILGCATTDEEVRRMAIYWGVSPLKVPSPTSVESLISAVENAALDNDLLAAGSTIVITSKLPFTEEQITNMLKLHTIQR